MYSMKAPCCPSLPVASLRGRGQSTQCALILLACALGCSAPPAEMAHPIEGAWTIQDASVVDAAGVVSQVDVRASLYIFGPQYYSVMSRAGDDINPPFSQLWNPTDAEKVQSFDSFSGNAGRYEISGSMLTLYPVVARGDVMDGSVTSEFRILADTLWVTWTDLRAPDGTQNAFYAGGGRREQRLIRVSN